MRWCVYLLRCGDGTLYAGITNDLPRRLRAHRCGRGARYTRGRGPLQLVRVEPARDRAAASRREHELKQMARSEKLALARGTKGGESLRDELPLHREGRRRCPRAPHSPAVLRLG